MSAHVELRQEPFDPSACLAQFMQRLEDDGAVVSFTGRARGKTREGLSVHALELESYRGVTLASMEQIAADAHTCFAITAGHVIHRAGRIGPGEAIVFVATASPHRRAAFEAADYLMDRPKTEAIFLKRERHAHGSDWIEPTDGDRKDVARWEGQ